MNTYEVRKIRWDRKHPENDAKAYENAEIKICRGLKEVWAFCGTKLKKGNGGYAGCIGDTGFLAVRIG